MNICLCWSDSNPSPEALLVSAAAAGIGCAALGGTLAWGRGAGFWDIVTGV